jgi:TP53 regulating kinase-like protein
MKEPMDPWIKSLELSSSSSSDWILVSQGAEARVWKVPAPPTANFIPLSSIPSSSPSSCCIICKERFPKTYRHPSLDERLIKARVKAEVKALEKCLASGLVRVPKVLRVDAPILYLEYLQGPSVRAYLEDLLLEKQQPQQQQPTEPSTPELKTSSLLPILLLELAKAMGDTVAKVHSLGIVHGDLTTSNMMLLQVQEKGGVDSTAIATTAPSSSGNNNTTVPYFFSMALIDFGLAKNGTTSVEERAVDLYVLERALEATHPQVIGEDFSTTLFESYRQHMNNNSKTSNNNKTSNDDNKPQNHNNDKRQKNSKQYNSGDAILQRLDKVRQRGRKRECFG